MIKKSKSCHCDPEQSEGEASGLAARQAISIFGIASSLSLLAMTCFFLCHFSFAQETVVQPQAEQQQPPPEQVQVQQEPKQEEPKQEEPKVEIPVIGPDAILWLEDSLPLEAAVDGEWNWAQDVKFSGTSSHTDGIKKGLHSHSFKVASGIKLAEDSVIEQYVFLDAQNPPKGIMIKLIAANGEYVDLYWEAEEEVFVDTLEYMQAWYMGFLPEPSRWHKLVINIKELEVKSTELVGISFITYDGKSYWDRTLLTNLYKE